VITQKAINKPSINLSYHALYVAASAGNFIVAPCERRPILSIQPDDVKSPPSTAPNRDATKVQSPLNDAPAARESKTALAGAAPPSCVVQTGFGNRKKTPNELIHCWRKI